MSLIENNAKFEKMENFEKILNLIKMLIIIQKVNLKASEKFKEKHPTHRGLPVGNQVDGLPTELRNESRKFGFPGGQRLLMKIAIGN